MANQSIALQARAPQSDPLGGAIRNNAQMINMMMQQQAAQRQNAIAEQTMQIQRAEEARKTAMAAPQLEKAQSEAGAARLELVTKAVGHALHTSVNNPTDETLDRAAATLAGIGLNPAEIDREIMPIKQLPLDQRKGALMQSIMSDPSSKAAYEATLPKPKELRLGDRIVLVDENPLSATFNQPIRSEMVGVSPNTTFKKTGGGIPAGRGGGGVPTAGQYGAAIESAAMQLAPGVRVSGRGRTPERNAEVGGVADSYHLSDNARDLQPARGQSLDQLAASLAPLKQQGFDVIIERGKNHVHVEPGPGMGRAGAAPAAGGGQLQGPVKGKSAAPGKTTEDERKISSNVRNMVSAVKDLVAEVQANPTSMAPGTVEYAAGNVPLYGEEAARFAQSGGRQRFNTAMEKMLAAVTFINTGAGVSKEQMNSYRKSYFPTFQDTPRTRQSKLLGAVQFIRDAKTRAGNAWTPDLDAALNQLQATLGRKATYEGKSSAAPAAKSSLPDDVRKKYGL